MLASAGSEHCLHFAALTANLVISVQAWIAGIGAAFVDQRSSGGSCSL